MENKNQKKISIILPVYNGGKYLSNAIQSVCHQEYENWELIVVDDCSSDNSGEVIQNFLSDPRIMIIRNEVNLGIQKSLNKGLSFATGEYVARIDDDDEWIDKEKLTKQVAFLDSHGEYVLVGTDAIVRDKDGNKIGEYHMPKADDVIRKKILTKNCFLHASIMARRAAIKRVGMYSEDRAVIALEDYDLWLRLGTVGRFANLDSVSIAITLHPESISAQNRVRQARGSLGLNLLYSRKYPHYMLGHIIGIGKLWFFKIISLLPFLGRHVYRIQMMYKNM